MYHGVNIKKIRKRFAELHRSFITISCFITAVASLILFENSNNAAEYKHETGANSKCHLALLGELIQLFSLVELYNYFQCAIVLS